jgi:ABC-type transporter Mla maintaining outer membrane lipid asymmetry ATPase subunit MlaF
MVSHDMDEIARNADRILVLKSAGVLMSGTPQEVFSRPEELLSAGLDVPRAARIAMALRRRGLAISPDVCALDALEREILRLRKEAVPC